MYVHFCNPFKNQMKLALLTIYWDRKENYGENTISHWFSITILNFSFSHSWVTDKK